MTECFETTAHILPPKAIRFIDQMPPSPESELPSPAAFPQMSIKAQAGGKTATTTGMSTAATFALKSSLRKGMLKTLKMMSDGDVQQQSEAVLRILREQAFFRDAKSVGCYLSMKHGELRTGGIVDHLLQRGTSLYTPYIPPQQSQSKAESSLDTPKGSSDLPSVSQVQAQEPDMKMLKLYNPADLEKCPLDKWGILDPGLERRDLEGAAREDSVEVDEPLDLILIPGVAFDEECNRLGRGKAYYDRFLLSYTAKKPSPLLVALALSPQMLPSGERVPTTELDFRLDGVISPEGIVWRNGSKRE